MIKNVLFLFDHVFFHFPEVETFGGFLDFERMQFIEFFPLFLKIGSMLIIKLMLELGALLFIMFHLFIPEVIEIIHLLLMGLVDLMDFVLVPDFHFVDTSVVELFFELFGLDSIVLGFDVVGSFLVLGHGGEDLVEFGLELVSCLVGFEIRHG